MDICKLRHAGDVAGGIEKKIGKTDNAQQCFTLVMQKEELATGATYSPVPRYCYAEFGATSIYFDICPTCQACIFAGRLMMLPNNSASSEIFM